MRGFVLHPGAFRDLEEIWEYIAPDNVDAADRVVEEIYEVIRALASHPGMGTNAPTLLQRRSAFILCEILLLPMHPMKNRWPSAILHGRRNPRVIAAILRGRE